MDRKEAGSNMMIWGKSFCSHFLYLYVRFRDMYVYINVLVTEIYCLYPKVMGILVVFLCVY